MHAPPESIQEMGGQSQSRGFVRERTIRNCPESFRSALGKPIAHFEGDLGLGPTKLNAAVIEIGGDRSPH